MSITAQLCTKLADLHGRQLPPEILNVARQLLLDGLAVGVAGAKVEPAPAILAEHFQAQGGKPAASVLGLGLRLPATWAALVNGASMHVLDYEPMWLPSTHALSPALGAALAAAEITGAEGRELAAAIIKGIEIQGWLLAAQGDVRSKDYRFHPPGAVGPIGAAVAAGHILKLDAERLACAIGIAASRCGGLFTNSGTMTKASHCGYAASLGLEAAMLAARGFTASTEIFDAKTQSYGQALLAPGFDPSALLNVGTKFRVLDPGYAIKLFPCKFTTHYSICAALAVRPKVPSRSAIASVRMRAAEVPTGDRPQPRTGLECKFSVQYTAAAALLDGEVKISTFTDERLNRADMKELLPKMQLEMSPDIPSKYTAGRYLDMEIEMKDGSRVTERCTAPRGSWGTPPVSTAEHLAKVRDCLSMQLSSDEAERCIELAGALDSLSADQVREMIQLCSGRKKLPAQ
jgi:aconitate decarboxylase